MTRNRFSLSSQGSRLPKSPLCYKAGRVEVLVFKGNGKINRALRGSVETLRRVLVAWNCRFRQLGRPRLLECWQSGWKALAGRAPRPHRARIATMLGRLMQGLGVGLRSGIDRLRDLTFPISCGRCGAAVSESDRWCQACARALGHAAGPPQPLHQCPRCAASCTEKARSNRGCAACTELDLDFDSVAALGSYHGALRRWMIDVKRSLDPPLIAALSESLVERLVAGGIDRQIDVIVPVPPRRLGNPESFEVKTDRKEPPHRSDRSPRKTSSRADCRGRFLLRIGHAMARIIPWVQACRSRHGSLPTLLAERIALQLGLPFWANLVQYRRSTRKQGQLRMAERRRNVRDSMAMRRFASRDRVAGRRVLVVDDVLTSGATLTELARVLREAGACQIHVAVLARAAADPPHRPRTW